MSCAFSPILGRTLSDKHLRLLDVMLLLRYPCDGIRRVNNRIRIALRARRRYSGLHMIQAPN